MFIQDGIKGVVGIDLYTELLPSLHVSLASCRAASTDINLRSSAANLTVVEQARSLGVLLRLWCDCSRCTGYRPIMDAFKVFAHVPASAYTEDSIKAQQPPSGNSNMASENGFPGPKRPAEQTLPQPASAKKVPESCAISVVLGTDPASSLDVAAGLSGCVVCKLGCTGIQS